MRLITVIGERTAARPRRTSALPELALRPVVVTAGLLVTVLVTVLVALSARYGYHRDEP